MSEVITLTSEQFQALISAAGAIPALQQQILTMQNTASSTQREVGYKVKEPEPFTGKRTDLARFLSQLALVFDSAPGRFAGAESRIPYAASLLRGTAFTWLQPQLDAVPKPDFMLNWDLFVASLRSAFGDPNQKHNAEKMIHSLRQRSSASLYASDFRRLASYIDWNNAALLFQYQLGLKEDLKDELAKLEPITNLDQLITTTIKIDDRLFDRRRERPNLDRPTGSGPIRRDDPHFMDVDAVSSSKPRGPLSDEEKRRRRELNLCLYCGEKGHSACDCPKCKSGKSSARKPSGSF
jgi:hypothetical protein